MIRKLAKVATDYVGITSAYLRDGVFRNAVRERLFQRQSDMSHGAEATLEFEATPVGAQMYHGLTSTSVALASISHRDQPPKLNLVIGMVATNKIFAGIHTALTVGIGLASRLGIPLRVIMLDVPTTSFAAKEAESEIRAVFGLHFDLEVWDRGRLVGVTTGSQDIWLATHWLTAHAIQVAVEAGAIPKGRTTYLVQDYEPGFSAWSTDFALARATYHDDVDFIINSRPLHQFLTRQEGIVVPEELVFAPSFETERLRAAALRRTSREHVNLLFYGRPSKHRNLFRLGVASLRGAIEKLGVDGDDVYYWSAGEKHPDIELGRGQVLRSLGKVPWDEYFERLSDTDVMLSLQFSPHPSHPPFDAALSGATAVTNEFFDTRSELHPRIRAVEAEPAALALAIAEAVRGARGNVQPFVDIKSGVLGRPLDSVLETVSTRLRNLLQ